MTRQFSTAIDGKPTIIQTTDTGPLSSSEILSVTSTKYLIFNVIQAVSYGYLNLRLFVSECTGVDFWRRLVFHVSHILWGLFTFSSIKMNNMHALPWP